MGRMGPKISLVVTSQNTEGRTRTWMDVPLEEGIAFLDVLVDCWGDASLFHVDISPNHELGGRFGHHISKTLKVALGDDASVRVGSESLIEAELCGCLLDRVNKGILSRAWDQDVVRRHADLRDGDLVSEVKNGKRAPFLVGVGGVRWLTCPAFVDLPQRIRLAAILRFVVLESITTGDFPPNSRVTGVRCSAAALATMRATVPFPV